MFIQAPPRLGNQYDDDPLLRELLARLLPPPMVAAIEPELRHLGELAGGELYRFQLADRMNEPKLVSWDAWGNRIDEIEVSPLWKHAAVLAAEHGLVAAGYEPTWGPHARLHQFALNTVVDASLDVYSCPLAMTDGAARTLLEVGTPELRERAFGRLTSRDPAAIWTSGQWMTERTGGSDVSTTETVARQTPEGFRLHGVKWFTSAITCQMALTLARPEGATAGSRGLALFYVETKRPDGTSNGILVHRLKDKLGTRKVPTAEITLDGALATPVAGLDHGVRSITPMLNVTRIWNSVGAIAGMRRAMALTTDYARRRTAFGKTLAEQPLHVDTLAGIEAEREAATLLTFRAIELLGRCEAKVASDAERHLWRLVTPLTKLTTARQAVTVSTEAVEAMGGAGYVEDTGLPRLVRDAQVLPIWEGTTNVLSLDSLRAIAQGGALEALAEEIRTRTEGVRDAALRPAVQKARAALEHAVSWLQSVQDDAPAREAGARRFALTLGRSFELALLCDHAQWCLDNARGPRALAAARRFAESPIDLVITPSRDDAAVLIGSSVIHAYQAIVVAHVLAAMTWFGAGLSLPRRLRLGLARSRPEAQEAAAEVMRGARVALVAGALAIASGFLLVLVGGGLDLYSSRLQVGMALAVLAFAIGLLGTWPAWGRVARIAAGSGALDEAAHAARRAAVLHGITQALLVVALALMLWTG